MGPKREATIVKNTTPTSKDMSKRKRMYSV
jgi:hypothetical protein